MTLADDLKPLARDIRGIPGDLGIRPHSVAILEREWSGAYSGDGVKTDATYAITEGRGAPPKVRWLSDEELAVSGESSGSVDIGPITSDHGAIARLGTIDGRNIDAGDARYIVITGPKHPNGAKYRITRVTADRAIHYMVRAAPVSR